MSNDHDDLADGNENLSPWVLMARELAERPDSPRSLRIMSSVAAALRPGMNVRAAVVEALTHRMEHAGDLAEAGVSAAIGDWEAFHGLTMSDEILKDLQEEAAHAIERRRCMPPALESVVEGVQGRTDVGYDLGVHLVGLRGTWHRLWAAIAMSRAFGPGKESQMTITVVREQFEGQLGRSLSPKEWSQLEAHAIEHGDRMAAKTALGGARQG